MEHKMEWFSEEEGRITFYEEGKEWISFSVYVISGDEAEWKMNAPEIVDTIQKTGQIPDEIISKVTKSLVESFRLLWEEGFEETILVEQKGTEIWKILNSTKVVKKSYSEYMMHRVFRSGEIVAHNSDNLILTEEEDGFVCENKEKSFFCRLLPYGSALETGRGFYVCEVEVAEEKRNCGTATECLRELFCRLAEPGQVTIYLQVGSYNRPAVHLYEKLGFEVQEELCCYVTAE
ncbi:MAG: GNAT family N-acetyltransferase [Lachnospiraceae bacterium]|nr:GNAT family N-acetyltransferase [Lachnospiraceae bacterium]